MRVALFKNIQFEHTSPWASQPMTDGYVQVSGWVDVDFPPLSPEEQSIAEKLLALGNRQKTFEEDFRRQRKTLDEERKALVEKLQKSA